jgi:hypothetical protein
MVADAAVVRNTEIVATTKAKQTRMTCKPPKPPWNADRSFVRNSVGRGSAKKSLQQLFVQERQPAYGLAFLKMWRRRKSACSPPVSGLFCSAGLAVNREAGGRNQRRARLKRGSTHGVPGRSIEASISALECRLMPGKRVQIDDETWAVLDLLARDRMMTFQEVADEALADFLKKYGRPVGLKAALRKSAGASADVIRLKKPRKKK